MTCNQVIPSKRSIKFNAKHLTFATDWHGHLNFASWLLELSRPKSIVELGVFRGDSLAAFSQAASELEIECSILGADTWGGDLTTGEYSAQIFDQVRDYFLFNHPNTVLAKMTFNDARQEVENNSVDVLHVDGCHTYDAVKEDFETWISAMSSKGIMLFHDVHVSNKDFGTGKFWHEVSDEFPSFSFKHSSGLGVLLVGSDAPSELFHLATCEDCLAYARAIFEMTGLRYTYNDKYRWQLREIESIKNQYENRANLASQIQNKKRRTLFNL